MIAPVVFPVAAGAVTMTAAALAAHRVLLQSAWLSALVPGYPVWWYGLTRGRRAAVAVTLPAAGALTGLAFQVAPLSAAGTVAVLMAATLASRTIRAATRKGR